MPQDDQRNFRNALGSFATGVTIATTKDGDGNPIGVTASSFNSVSVDPPLVLWSLAKNSHSRAAFCQSGHFAVHVLSASQENLSNRFARSGEDKFSDVAWSPGKLDSPVLDEHAALFQCRTRHQYEGGDHIILVGEVVEYETREEAPLLFHGGSYAERRPRPKNDSGETVDTEHGRFTDDFLFYLISRAHFQTSRPTREKLAELGSSMEEYLTLAVLSMEAPLTRNEIGQRLNHTGHAPAPRLLDYMTRKKLIREVDRVKGFDLEEEGRKLFVETLAFGKAFEADLADHFTAAELAETKQVLRRIIELSGEDVPINWRARED
ncbi:flavin reductase [Erythrobacter alti]|uniref:flavin reductase n=1 Tax=Erythrobacter alti TaxID=1896145 RepID=UPI0030F38B4C